MDTIATISLSTTGTTTGQSFAGEFEVKTVLSRRDQFAADQKRREILGGIAQDQAMATLVGEAFMLGQLFVRITKAPDWWTTAGYGLDLKDSNVISELYEHALAKQAEAQRAIKEQAKAALEKIAEKK